MSPGPSHDCLLYITTEQLQKSLSFIAMKMIFPTENTFLVMKTTPKIQHRKRKKQFWKLSVFCAEVYCAVLQSLNFSKLRQRESIRYSLFEVISSDLRVLLLPTSLIIFIRHLTLLEHFSESRKIQFSVVLLF